jgi:hypothetical protein
MNNFLFTALLIALLYYFFYYLPSQKKLTANPPLKHHQSTQTESLTTDPDPQALNHLQQQLSEKDNKLKELATVENQIDQLIKGIQNLNQELN